VHVVAESPEFSSDAKAAGLSEDEIRQIITFLASVPLPAT